MRHFSLLVFACAALNTNAADLKSVSFSQDTVTEIDGRVVKFLTGSAWLLEREIAAVPMGDGVIVCSGEAPRFEKEKMKEYTDALPKSGVFIYEGEMVSAKLVSGV